MWTIQLMECPKKKRAVVKFSNYWYTQLNKCCPMLSVNCKWCDLMELLGDLISVHTFSVFLFASGKYVNFNAVIFWQEECK